MAWTSMINANYIVEVAECAYDTKMRYKEPSEEEKRLMEKEAMDIVGELFGKDE